ncbi:MAG: hypothetical protein E2O39_11100 [Planctomycetota bacterium]|nr:MAG: hypothetical protein E2O39_11100 [Planctomycetota bacterium]
MTHHPTACALDCPDTCGVLVETDEAGAFVGVKGNPAHPHSRGALCGKTAIFGDVVNSPDRLRTPLLRANGGFEPITWERAIGIIAERIAPLAGEDVLALYYAGCMGLVNRRFPMRMLNALGAIETDGSVCDTTSTLGYELVYGRVVGPDLETMDGADCLVLWGIDAKRTFQHLLPAIQRLCKRGVLVTVIDIYRTDTIRAIEAWGGRGLIVRPGTDAALALGLARLAFERGRADLQFMRRECTGGAEFRAHLGAEYGLEATAECTGLAVREITAFADALFAASKPFLKTGVGFARRRNGGMSMRAVCSLGAVLGIVDRVHYESFDHFGFDDSVMTRPELRPPGATAETVNQVSLGGELAAGRFAAAFVWGHNPAATLPDANRVRAGLERDDLFLVVHELFMTETAQLATLVLPATSFVEQSDVYRSYGHRVLQYGKKAVEPLHEARSNVDTFRAIAAALALPPETHDVTEEGLVRELLEAHRERIGAEDMQRVLAGEPVKLRPRPFADRGTPSGKIELASASAEAMGEPRMATYVPDDGADGIGAFWLVCAPSIATHNSTFSHSSRHRKRAGAPVCHLNPAEGERLGVVDGDRVTLENGQGRLTFPVRLSGDVPRGIVRVDGFPDPAKLPEGIGINALTSPSPADLGRGNVLYSARVDVRRID